MGIHFNHKSKAGDRKMQKELKLKQKSDERKRKREEQERQKLADQITGSEVHIIKNCGHMMLLEEADQTLSILKKFIIEKYPNT